MTAAREIMARARLCVGGGRYKLGAGGFDPAAERPWNKRMELDCSGFAAWVFGVPRKNANPFYVKQNGGWFESTAIFRDAYSEFGYVSRETLPRPGQLYVTPDEHGKQGHVAIIAKVSGYLEDYRVLSVIDCSATTFERRGYAVSERPVSELGHHPRAIFASVAWVDYSLFY